MPGSGHFDVFVSHAHKDRAVVVSLVEQLRQAGLAVWLDEDQIRPGDSIAGRIEEGLSCSTYLLVCLSPAFLESKWTGAELRAMLYAQIERDLKRVLPVVVAEVEETKIPPLLASLASADARTADGRQELLAFLTGRDRQPAAPPTEEAEELRLFLRAGEDGIEGQWSIGHGLGPPFVITSPIGPKDQQDHRWYLQEYLRYPGIGDISRAQGIEQRLEQWGRQLYQAVAGGAGGQRLADLVQRRAPCQLTLVSQDAGPLALPWELLRDERSVLLARGLVIRRQLPVTAARVEYDLALPLRLLLVVARPVGTGFIDPRSSATPLLDALAPLGGNVTVELCDPPTLAEVSRRLAAAQQRGRPYQIVHFDGHGVYLPETGVGALCFENDDGELDLVPGRRLGDLLAQMDIPVALLEACQTADLSAAPVFGSVAPALLQSGVGSVIAFSHAVLVVAARLLVERFYSCLCDGLSVGQALNQGRMLLLADPQRHVRPGSEPLPLHDWHIPQLYQAGDDPVLVPGGARRVATGPPLVTGREPDRAFGHPPVYGFFGRARELLQLRRTLVRHGGTVALTGMGGMGKTSLAREAAAWWSRTGRRRHGAAFFSFETRQGAERAVQAFGRYLEGDAFERLSGDEQWQRAVQLFHEREVLWVWDNFESTLPAFQRGRDIGTAFAEEERRRLQELYRDLTAGSPAGWLLVTCRPADTGLPGIAEMELGSLSAQEALEMATVILQRKGVPLGRKGWERDEVVRLLEVLGHHPLSLELVLPHLKTMRPAEVVTDLGTLLDRFTSPDAEEARNRGLRASLTFSLDRLSEAAQQVVPYLGWFDGGAFEQRIIDLCQVEAQQWDEVRGELLATALVEVDDATTINDRPFLRFHPTLTYVAAEDRVADHDTTRERFVATYLAMAGGVYKALQGTDPAGGMAVMDREEGNLRRAVELAFEAGDHRLACSIANGMGIYLDRTGRVRDRARWTAWVQSEVERVGGEGADLDEAACGAARQHAWGLMLEGRAVEALERMEDLIARLERARGDGVPRQLALSRQYHGRVFYMSGQSARALEPLSRAIQGLEKAGDRPNLAAAIGDQANALRMLGRHAEALTASERGLAIRRELGNHREIAAGLGRTAQILKEMQKWAEAEQRYEEALEAARCAGDPGLEATLLQHLGGLHRARGRFTEAVACYKEALERFRQTDDDASEMRTCDLLGSAETDLEHFDAARSWYERARELARRRGDQRQLAATSQNLGVLCQSQALALGEGSEQKRTGLLQGAVASVEESLSLEREMNNDVGAASSLAQLGVLHLLLGDLDSAESLLLESLGIYESLGLPDVYKVYANLGEVAEVRGDAAAAAEWRAKMEAKIAELRRLRAQGAEDRLPTGLAETLLAMARDAFATRASGRPPQPQLAEALATLGGMPAPLPEIATFLEAVAHNRPVPAVPPDLPPELANILHALAEAIATQSGA